MSTTTHTPGPGQFETPLHEQLFWAEHHANDLTIAEHNRKRYAEDAIRLRAAIAKATGAAA